ncbi:MAG: hypothetical protein FWG14_08925 [Peptococcaceae bacterium]|nr:hypothetical protein [Peptococcaceae bacterium]
MRYNLPEDYEIWNIDEVLPAYKNYPDWMEKCERTYKALFLFLEKNRTLAVSLCPAGETDREKEAHPSRKNRRSDEFSWDGNRLLSEDRGSHQRQGYLYEPDSFVPLAVVRSEAVEAAPRRKAGALPAGLPKNVVADLSLIREEGLWNRK